MENRKEIKKILDFSLNKEGFYSNNQKDKGKETYRGISRIFFPNWEGWTIIDRYKKNTPDTFECSLPMDKELQNFVYDFYRNYLKELCLEDFPFEVSTILCDAAINCGQKNSIKFLQRGIISFTDAYITADGILGDQTKNKILNTVDEYGAFQTATCGLLPRIRYYVNIGHKNNNSVFFYGWIKRVMDVRDFIKQKGE